MKRLELDSGSGFPFDPDDFDIFHVGISGGKDSAALLLWLWYESGLPHEKIMPTTNETDNEDQLTYKFIDLLAEATTEIKKVVPRRVDSHEFPKGIGFYDLARFKKFWPSANARYCTQYLKIIPSRDHVLSLLQEGKRVLVVNGIRRAEGKPGVNKRAEMEPFDWAEDYACHVYRPILNWTIDQVWDIHKKYLDFGKILDMIDRDWEMSEDNKAELIRRMESHGIPRNPLYDMGAKRVGCFPCIFSRKAEIRAMDRFRPERVDLIREFEDTWVGAYRIGGSIGTFFAYDKVPPQFRSKRIVLLNEDTNEVRVMHVPTIADVVLWSKTGNRRPKQFEMDLYIEDENSCSIGGYCE